MKHQLRSRGRYIDIRKVLAVGRYLIVTLTVFPGAVEEDLPGEMTFDIQDVCKEIMPPGCG